MLESQHVVRVHQGQDEKVSTTIQDKVTESGVVSARASKAGINVLNRRNSISELKNATPTHTRPREGRQREKEREKEARACERVSVRGGKA